MKQFILTKKIACLGNGKETNKTETIYKFSDFEIQTLETELESPPTYDIKNK